MIGGQRGERVKMEIPWRKNVLALVAADMEIAGIRTPDANREASMQRWLLGITATTVVGVSSAMAGVAAALV